MKPDLWYSVAKYDHGRKDVASADSSPIRFQRSTIHLSNRAVPTIVIGVPVRYIHTHYGIVSVADVEHSAQLACAVLAALNKEIICGF